jgi:abhydrolase domain-containing protein 6
MRVKYVNRKNGKGVWCYAETKANRRHHSSHNNHNNHNRASKIVVFIHGFGADKDMWATIVNYMSKKHHYVMVDMPGHGGTTFDPEIDEPCVESYAKNLYEFLEMAHLNHSKITLVGCSFGGAIVTYFTYLYPDMIENLCLLCPALTSRQSYMSEALKEIMNGNFKLLIPENGVDFRYMIEFLCSKPQYWPSRIYQAYVNLNFNITRQKLLRKIMKNLTTHDLDMFDNELKDKFESFSTRTLIVWGDQDMVTK